MKQLLIETIRIDGGTQSRAAIDQATVAEYVEAIQAGAKMPPIIVYHDGTDVWLAEGFHRFLAYQRAEKRNILAEVKKGTKEDAAWASAGANLTHGLRRTNADKRHAVEMAVRLRPDLSPEAIGQHCGVSTTLATQIKKSLIQGGQVAHPDHSTGVDGKKYSLPPSRPPTQRPTTPPVPTKPPVSRPTAPTAPRTTAAAPEPPPTPSKPEHVPGPKPGQVDETGHPIPDHLLELWERRHEVSTLLTYLSEVRVAIGKAQKEADPLFAELNASAALANLNTTYDMVKATAPHAVCPWCHGTLSDQCRACKGRGLIGSFAWDRVPKELKKGRK